jgi:hypothetical protein
MSTTVGLTKTQRLRAELDYLRARYDHGAVAPAVYQIIKEIERDIAWCEHRAETTAGCGRRRQ